VAQAKLDGTVIAESTDVVIVEGNRYFPPAGVRKDLLTVGTRQYTCPWKGKTTYWDIHMGDKVYENAAWSYEAPKEAARQIAGHVAFDTSVVSVSE
jgi:uncharacterized protein (DUF427 family)